ncbi:MAG: DUF1467 family protein [Alphaproteobacteria bacterium]
MSVFTVIVVFVIIWWLVLFMVLPFGNRQPETVEEGHQAGAPENPHLLKKVLITTGISLVLFGLFWVIHDLDWITFRRPLD